MATAASLNPPQTLSQNVQPTVQAIDLVDSATANIQSMATPVGSQVPNLAGHVATVKDNARQWTQSIRPQIVGTLRGVAAFGGTFDSLFQPLSDAAVRIAENDLTAIPAFKDLLARLRRQIVQEADTVKQVKSALDGYSSEISTDARNFAKDENVLQGVEANDQSQISTLQGKIRSLDDEISQKRTIERTLGFLNPLFVELKKLIDTLTGESDDARQQLDRLQEELGEDQRNLLSAKQSSIVLGGYLNATLAVSTGVTAIASGWDSLDADFQTLLESTDIDAFNVFTQAVINAARLDWEDLVRQAQEIGGLQE